MVLFQIEVLMKNKASLRERFANRGAKHDTPQFTVTFELSSL